MNTPNFLEYADNLVGRTKEYVAAKLKTIFEKGRALGIAQGIEIANEQSKAFKDARSFEQGYQLGLDKGWAIEQEKAYQEEWSVTESILKDFRKKNATKPTEDN